MSDNNRLPSGQPQHWEDFLRVYGHAVYGAQLLEKNLATLLWFYESRKRNVIRRPTPQEIDAMIDKIDGNTIGDLLKSLQEYQIDWDAMQLFRNANVNRRILVHQFAAKFPDETGEASDFSEAVLRVRDLAAPIRAARERAEHLAGAEIERMRAQIDAEN